MTDDELRESLRPVIPEHVVVGARPVTLRLLGARRDEVAVAFADALDHPRDGKTSRVLVELLLADGAGGRHTYEIFTGGAVREEVFRPDGSLLARFETYELFGDVCRTQEWLDEEGHLHRDDGPAVECLTATGVIEEREYYCHGKLHRLDGPALESFDPEARDAGWSHHVQYFRDGKLHRDDGPAQIMTQNSGQTRWSTWNRDGTQLSRTSEGGRGLRFDPPEPETS